MAERRQLTALEVSEQLRGGRRLGPGVWVDRDGAMHVSVPELLELFGWPDTPENREEVYAACRQAFAQQAPNAEIIEQE